MPHIRREGQHVLHAPIKPESTSQHRLPPPASRPPLVREGGESHGPLPGEFVELQTSIQQDGHQTCRTQRELPFSPPRSRRRPLVSTPPLASAKCFLSKRYCPSAVRQAMPRPASLTELFVAAKTLALKENSQPLAVLGAHHSHQLPASVRQKAMDTHGIQPSGGWRRAPFSGFGPGCSWRCGGGSVCCSLF